MAKCSSGNCGRELELLKITSYEGFGYLGKFSVWTYECPGCHRQYQQRSILDEEAPTEHRVLQGELMPRMFTDEELETSNDSVELYEKYEKRTGIKPCYV